MVCLDMMVHERQGLTTQEQHEALVVKELWEELHYWLSVLMLIVAEVLVVLRQVQQSPILYLHLFACHCCKINARAERKSTLTGYWS